MAISLKLKKYILTEFNTKHQYKWIEDMNRWEKNEQKIHLVVMSKFDGDELLELKEICETNKKESNAANNLRQLNNYLAFASDYSGSQIVKKLIQFPVAFRAFFDNKQHKWLFIQDGDGELLPYFVYNVDYTPLKKDKHGVYPAYCDIDMIAYRKGSRHIKTVSIYERDIGYRISEILQNKDLFIETEESVKRYLKEQSRFLDLQTLTGKQMHAVGTGNLKTSSSYSSYSTSISMLRDGVPTKVVIDDPSQDSENSNSKSDQMTVSGSFWRGTKLKNDYLASDEVIFEISEEDKEQMLSDSDLDEDDIRALDETVSIQVHPYIQAFDLDKHDYLSLHVNNLVEYPWDESLFEKLILPEEQKELIHMLVANTGESISDIVRGKMNGIIVLATGSPGLGKTLTAEVFSETIKAPLYTVQCSQLGLDVDSVENNLKTILQRAERWKAILLIDEADVYIRERGNDIVQNAIVGVFLRILEYYRGVLFMTSNRGEIIDDAIMSRATAWIQYKLPKGEDLYRIWKVLSTQYEAKLKESDIEYLIDELGTISGRTIRNLLKLARLLAKKNNEKITIDLILQVSNYQQLVSKGFEEENKK